ncbi:UNVERIFIED_CONTAM: hypothetical protein O8I53_07640 [Campylobacter lari]
MKFNNFFKTLISVTTISTSIITISATNNSNDSMELKTLKEKYIKDIQKMYFHPELKDKYIKNINEQNNIEKVKNTYKKDLNEYRETLKNQIKNSITNKEQIEKFNNDVNDANTFQTLNQAEIDITNYLAVHPAESNTMIILVAVVSSLTLALVFATIVMLIIKKQQQKKKEKEDKEIDSIIKQGKMD